MRLPAQFQCPVHLRLELVFSRSFPGLLLVYAACGSRAAYYIAACRYEALAQQAEAMEKPYTALAKLLNCHADEIAIVTSSTTAWYQVKHHVIAL